MFSLGAGLYETYLLSREVSILLIGCDNAGKTSLLERIKVTDFSTSNISAAASRISSSHRHANNNHQHRQHESIVVSTYSFCTSHHHGNSEYIYEDQSVGIVPSISDSVIPPDARRPPQKMNRLFMERYQLIDPHRHFWTDLAKDSSLSSDDNVEYDVKAGKRMLPSHLIRPTIGMNLTKLEAIGLRIKILDLSGSPVLRSLWEKHYFSADAIVYVVDVSNQCHLEKLYEARAFFLAMRDHMTADDDTATTIPTLIFFNKIDLRRSSELTNHTTTTTTSNKNDDHSSTLAPLSLHDIASIFLKPGNVPPTTYFSICFSNLGGESSSSSMANSPNTSHGQIQDEKERNGDVHTTVDTNGGRHHKTLYDHYDHHDPDTQGSTENNSRFNHYQTTDKPITMAIATGSAETGEGVRLAFNWLFHTIKANL